MATRKSLLIEFNRLVDEIVLANKQFTKYDVRRILYDNLVNDIWYRRIVVPAEEYLREAQLRNLIIYSKECLKNSELLQELAAYSNTLRNNKCKFNSKTASTSKIKKQKSSSTNTSTRGQRSKSTRKQGRHSAGQR